MDHGRLEGSAKSVGTGFVVAAAFLGAASLIAAATLAPREAVAKPEFAAQTKKACGYCHQQPGGGGGLKPAGEKFKQNGNKL